MNFDRDALKKIDSILIDAQCIRKDGVQVFNGAEVPNFQEHCMKFNKICEDLQTTVKELISMIPGRQ